MVSDTMLMLKLVILLKLCLKATMDVVSIFRSCRLFADAAALFLYSKLYADKLASKVVASAESRHFRGIRFIIKLHQLDKIFDVASPCIRDGGGGPSISIIARAQLLDPASGTIHSRDGPTFSYICTNRR